MPLERYASLSEAVARGFFFLYFSYAPTSGCDICERFYRAGCYAVWKATRLIGRTVAITHSIIIIIECVYGYAKARPRPVKWHARETWLKVNTTWSNRAHILYNNMYMFSRKKMYIWYCIYYTFEPVWRKGKNSFPDNIFIWLQITASAALRWRVFRI